MEKAKAATNPKVGKLMWHVKSVDFGEVQLWDNDSCEATVDDADLARRIADLLNVDDEKLKKYRRSTPEDMLAHMPTVTDPELLDALREQGNLDD